MSNRDANELRERLVSFYRSVNPEKVDTVRVILQKYHGKEDLLVRSLQEKYSVDLGDVQEIADRVKLRHSNSSLPSSTSTSSLSMLQSLATTGAASIMSASKNALRAGAAAATPSIAATSCAGTTPDGNTLPLDANGRVDDTSNNHVGTAAIAASEEGGGDEEEEEEEEEGEEEGEEEEEEKETGKQQPGFVVTPPGAQSVEATSSVAVEAAEARMRALEARMRDLQAENCILVESKRKLHDTVSRQAAEVKAAERSLHDERQKSDTFYRNWMAVTERESALGATVKEQVATLQNKEEKLRSVEGRSNVAEHNAQTMQEKMLEAMRVQQFLKARLDALLSASSVGFNPYTKETTVDDAQCAQREGGEGGGDVPPSPSDEEGAMGEVALRAARAEIAQQQRLRIDAELCVKRQAARVGKLEEQAAEMRQELEAESRSAKALRERIEEISLELRTVTKASHLCQSQFQEEAGHRERVEGELREANGTIVAAAAARRELEAFAREQRQQVECNAAEMISEAHCTLLLQQEELLSQKHELANQQKELESKQLDEAFAEIEWLSKCLFEARRAKASSEEELRTFKLDNELATAATAKARAGAAVEDCGGGEGDDRNETAREGVVVATEAPTAGAGASAKAAETDEKAGATAPMLQQQRKGNDTARRRKDGDDDTLFTLWR